MNRYFVILAGMAVLNTSAVLLAPGNEPAPRAVPALRESHASGIEHVQNRPVVVQEHGRAFERAGLMNGENVLAGRSVSAARPSVTRSVADTTARKPPVRTFSNLAKLQASPAYRDYTGMPRSTARTRAERPPIDFAALREMRANQPIKHVEKKSR